MFGSLGAWFHVRLRSQVSLVSSPFSSPPWLQWLEKGCVLRLTRVGMCLAFYIPLTAVSTACSSVVCALFPFQNLLESYPKPFLAAAPWLHGIASKHLLVCMSFHTSTPLFCHGCDSRAQDSAGRTQALLLCMGEKMQSEGERFISL